MSRASINVFRIGVLSLLWLAAPAWAAKAETQELDEVLVNGVRIKPTRDGVWRLMQMRMAAEGPGSR
jgi:hypothetical protein